MKSSWNIWVDPKPSDMRPHKRTKGPTGTGQVRAEAELEGGSHEPRGAWALGAGRGRRTHTGSLRREGSPAATWTSEPCLPELRESVFLDGKRLSSCKKHNGPVLARGSHSLEAATDTPVQ